MHTIHLTDLKHYSAEIIHKFISIRGEWQFLISIPYNRTIRKNRFSSYVWNYKMAAYAGQVLSNVSRSFSYMVPDPTSIKEFHFLVCPITKKRLARALARISDGCFRTARKRNFEISASRYMRDVITGKKPTDTAGLISIANSVRREKLI